MAQVVRVALLAAFLAACKPVAPPEPPPGPVTVSATVVYQALVEAGCLSPDDGGLAAVMEEAQSDAEPPWLQCLFEAGSIQACAVPCQ